jgi:hypothetical protein
VVKSLLFASTIALWSANTHQNSDEVFLLNFKVKLIQIVFETKTYYTWLLHMCDYSPIAAALPDTQTLADATPSGREM